MLHELEGLTLQESNLIQVLVLCHGFTNIFSAHI